MRLEIPTSKPNQNIIKQKIRKNIKINKKVIKKWWNVNDYSLVIYSLSLTHSFIHGLNFLFIDQQMRKKCSLLTFSWNYRFYIIRMIERPTQLAANWDVLWGAIMMRFWKKLRAKWFKFYLLAINLSNLDMTVVYILANWWLLNFELLLQILRFASRLAF